MNGRTDLYYPAAFCAEWEQNNTVVMSAPREEQNSKAKEQTWTEAD